MVIYSVQILKIFNHRTNHNMKGYVGGVGVGGGGWGGGGHRNQSVSHGAGQT